MRLMASTGALFCSTSEIKPWMVPPAEPKGTQNPQVRNAEGMGGGADILKNQAVSPEKKRYHGFLGGCTKTS